MYAPERLSSTAPGRALRKRLTSAEEIDERTLESISDTVTSQGVVAAVAIPSLTAVAADGLVLVLDGIADPGNAGSMLRTARAAGAAAVVAMPNTTDLWSPKALRAGMGAHFHLVLTNEWPEREQVLLAAAGDGVPYWQVDWSRPTALIIGSEARGAGSAAVARSSARVTIPMAAGVESLNAAAAAAILLFHARHTVLACAT